jgi:hypothetical protein
VIVLQLVAGKKVLSYNVKHMTKFIFLNFCHIFLQVFNPICEICSRTWLEYLKTERNYQYCLSCYMGVRSLVIVPFKLNHREIEALHAFIVPIFVETIDGISLSPIGECFGRLIYIV